MKHFRTIFAVAGASILLCVSLIGCSSDTTSETSDDSSSTSTTETTMQEYFSALDEGMYVTTDWLAENAASVVVVDARSADTFAEEHIPGAVNIAWANFSNTAVAQGEEGWAELLSADELAASLAELGIDGSKAVVVYAEPLDGWGEDGRIYWTLREAGIEDVHILDGGWSKWLSDVGTSESSEAGEDADPITQVDTAYVNENIDSAVLVDARSAEEYNGELTMGEAREGRIPGAINIPVLTLLNDDGTVKSDDELASIFDEAGLDVSDEIIVYCTGGVRAAFVAEILQDQGYENVSVYTAGYSEWAGDESNEIEI